MKWLAVFLGITFIYLYLNMPVFALGFTDWSGICIFWGIVIFFVFATRIAHDMPGDFLRKLIFKVVEYVMRKKRHQDIRIVPPGTEDDLHLTRNQKRLLLAAGFLFTLGVVNMFILPLLTTPVFFYSNSYRNLIGTVTESSFTADIEPINLAQIRIVDEETARKLADKKIGEVPALGSEVQLGTLVLQKVRGGLYYVAPLEYRGFFQWLSNRSTGSKGYIMVSATNPQDVKLIQDINGKPVNIKYQMEGFVAEYLPRYLYFHGYFHTGMIDFSFEVDDDLNPYWIVTLYRNKIGYSGHEATGVVLVDAQTGAIQQYSIADAPQWVDRMQPEKFIYQQIAYWGEYINGFWNSVLAKAGTLKPAENNLHLIYGNDDNVYWYTGITSSGKDQSTVGFILVNSRTKEAKWYKVAGATEAAARQSAEGQVQEKSYRSSYPILYNINGVPTYISALKDKEGLIKLIAFVSVENYNLVGVGPDIESALRAYRTNLVSKGNLFVPDNVAQRLQMQGKIVRISQTVRGGESFYYFTVGGQDKIFAGTVNVSAQLPLLQPGDDVTVFYEESKGPVTEISKLETVAVPGR